MELIFNSCGEFRWTPESPVSQIQSPHLHASAPGNFSDLLRSVDDKRESRLRKATGSYRTYSSLVKLQLGSWVCNGRPAFGQNCSLRSWVCSEGPALGQNTNDDPLVSEIWILSKFQNVPCALGFEVKHSTFFCMSFRSCIIILSYAYHSK